MGYTAGEKENQARADGAVYIHDALNRDMDLMQLSLLQSICACVVFQGR